MTALASVDELRALPLPVALAVLRDQEAELGPEGVAALLTPVEFYRRPAQRFPRPDEQWAICVYLGEYGTGKTWTAVQLFLFLILTGVARRPRIICATGPAIEGTIIDGPSGIRAWLPPGVVADWKPSKGHEGELWIRWDGGDVRVTCCSADAPGQAIGEGSDLDLRDDVAKWVVSCGAEGARAAWAAASKSCREEPGLAIVPTTPDGVAFIADLLTPGQLSGVLVIDLGAATENRGNLSRNFLEHVLPNLKAQGLWSAEASASPFAAIPFDDLRLDAAPPPVEMGVAIDPSLSSGARSCEVGIVGGWRDARSTVHVRHDRSAVLDAGARGWPAVAWDLYEELQAEHPGAPIHFVLEDSRGGNQPEALLRGEERVRRLRKGLPEVSVCEVRRVTAKADKCKRAESPARLASQKQVRFARGLAKLEGQLRRLTPDGTDSDGADASVHLVNDLAGLNEAAKPDPAEAARAAFAGFAAAQERMPPPAMGAPERRSPGRGERMV